MEPRLLRRGNPCPASIEPAPIGLQWSHAFSDVETNVNGTFLRMFMELQWSHAFSDVETKSKDEAIKRARECFNGATPSQTWKHRRYAHALLAQEQLQWSHAFSDVETE